MLVGHLTRSERGIKSYLHKVRYSLLLSVHSIKVAMRLLGMLT
jgi:hypothetical protein